MPAPLTKQPPIKKIAAEDNQKDLVLFRKLTSASKDKDTSGTLKEMNSSSNKSQKQKQKSTQ